MSIDERVAQMDEENISIEERFARLYAMLDAMEHKINLLEELETRK